jgi:hypothetical protein
MSGFLHEAGLEKTVFKGVFLLKKPQFIRKNIPFSTPPE